MDIVLTLPGISTTLLIAIGAMVTLVPVLVSVLMSGRDGKVLTAVAFISVAALIGSFFTFLVSLGLLIISAVGLLFA